MPAAPALRSYGYAATPLGRVRIVISGGELAGLDFEGSARAPQVTDETPGSDITLRNVAQQLDEYFRGMRTRFELPLRLEGTPFQVAAWSALLEIPYGQTRSYSELAAWIGHPSAARAVGAANGQNPISIVVPCHRLIGRDGDLTGYGGGIDRKRRLLDLERAIPMRGPQAAQSEPSVRRVRAGS
jgi:methylated-DNA-[protein]-cysteine S-methyltransferase